MVDKSVAVFLNAFSQLPRQVRALDAVNEIVIEQPVFLDIEHADGLFTIRLDEIVAIAVLIGEVDIGDERRLAEGVKHIPPEGEYRVVDT